MIFSKNSNGEQIAAIPYSIVNIDQDLKRVILEYNCLKEPVKYTVELKGVITNLDKQTLVFHLSSTERYWMNLINFEG